MRRAADSCNLELSPLSLSRGTAIAGPDWLSPGGGAFLDRLGFAPFDSELLAAMGAAMTFEQVVLTCHRGFRSIGNYIEHKKEARAAVLGLIVLGAGFAVSKLVETGLVTAAAISELPEWQIHVSILLLSMLSMAVYLFAKRNEIFEPAGALPDPSIGEKLRVVAPIEDLWVLKIIQEEVVPAVFGGAFRRTKRFIRASREIPAGRWRSTARTRRKYWLRLVLADHRHRRKEAHGGKHKRKRLEGGRHATGGAEFHGQVRPSTRNQSWVIRRPLNRR